MKEEFKANINNAEKEGDLKKLEQLSKGAEAMGMGDVAEQAQQAISNLKLAEEEMKGFSTPAENEIGNMDGNTGEIQAGVDEKSQEAEAVVSSAENQIGELSAEESAPAENVEAQPVSTEENTSEQPVESAPVESTEQGEESTSENKGEENLQEDFESYDSLSPEQKEYSDMVGKLKEQEAEIVVDGAEAEIGELSVEDNLDGKDLYIENLNNEINGLELKLDEVETKRESIVESIANLFGENSDNFKALLSSSGGWPSDNKSAESYGFGELSEGDERRYRELMHTINPLYMSRNRIKGDFRLISDDIKFIEKVETSDDKINILKKLEDPKNTDILLKLDALSQAKILEDQEVFDVMRTRISNLENIYDPESKTFNAEYGSTPEYELAVRLRRNLSNDLVEKMKKEGHLGDTFDKAYVEFEKIKDMEEKRDKENEFSGPGLYDEIYP